MAEYKEKEDKHSGEGKIASAYNKKTTERSAYEESARRCAELTIPTLFPPSSNSDGKQELPTPYQSVGARGVNNIANKLLLALFPANQPFFKLNLDEKTKTEMGETQGAVDKALGKIEKIITAELNASPSMRVRTLEAFKQLMVAGNVLVYVPPKENVIRVFRLDRYVVERDAMGNPLCIIVKEDLTHETLPKEVTEDTNYDGTDDQKDISLYTKVYLEKGTWEVTQECMGKLVGKTVTYPKDKFPWLPLRLIAMDNEDYGRSFVEQYYGDLLSLEGLMRAIVEGSAAAAKLIFMVSPNGTTTARDIAEANNLDVISGDSREVSTLQSDKSGDFRVALETANGIIERLSFAFMLNSAVQRSGERVTAEEIRYVANELEENQGGIYSILAQDYQLPLLNILMSNAQKAGKIPALPKGAVKPAITTGMEALGRTADIQKLDMFLQQLSALGEQTLAKYLNVGEYIKRRAGALQVDVDGLIRSDEEIQQAEQAQKQEAQQAQLMQAATPNAVKAAGDMAGQAMASQQPQEGATQ